MGRCYSCKGEALTAATAELELVIAGRTFQTTVAVFVSRLAVK